jgi:hypothetical protein
VKADGYKENNLDANVGREAIIEMEGDINAFHGSVIRLRNTDYSREYGVCHKTHA